MKTLSGTFALILAGIAVVTFLSCCEQQLKSKAKPNFVLEIGTKTIWGAPKTYVEWTTEDEFDEALKQVCQHGGTYEIRKLKADGEKPYDAKPCIEILKTVKVTKSKVAGDRAAGASAGNDPNTVYKVAAARVEDIKKVLDALATPTPTP